jgi:hypothetical protein
MLIHGSELNAYQKELGSIDTAIAPEPALNVKVLDKGLIDDVKVPPS